MILSSYFVDNVIDSAGRESILQADSVDIPD